VARQYQLKSFLRSAPNDLLQRYLADRGIGTDVDWEDLSETRIDPVFNAITSAPASERSKVDADFRDIDGMATDGGIKTLIEEAEFRKHGPGIADEIGQMDGHHRRAFWAFLEHDRVFEVAKDLNRADNLPRRSWRTRSDLPEASAATDQESGERLAEAVSAYYRQKEGRGYACSVDHYERGDRLFWFVYPEDWARTEVGYGEDGELKPWTWRPAFEVVFAHSPEEHSLEVYAKGSKHTAWDLQKLFGRVILGVDLADPDASPPPYRLNGLKRRDFPFPVDSADGIDDVRVRKLRFYLIGRGNRRITLEANVQQDREAVYDLLDQALAEERVPLELLNVSQAGLQIVFRPDKPGGRGTTLNFDISYPESCSLKQDPKDLVAKEYLKRWGIQVPESIESASQGGRGRAQYMLRGQGDRPLG